MQIRNIKHLIHIKLIHEDIANFFSSFSFTFFLQDNVFCGRASIGLINKHNAIIIDIIINHATKVFSESQP